MSLSLVQKENWTNPTEANAVEVTDEEQPNPGNDMVCIRHKGTKLALLVHIIDGFVIEESNVPFKGAEKEDEVSEAAKPIPTLHDKSQLQSVEEDKENEIANASMNSYPEDKDELMSLLPTSCKYCGGELPEDRAMWGKRFCSVSCSKKYSVTCSQRMRHALQRRSSQGTENTIEYENGDVNRSIRSPVKRRRASRGRVSSVTETTQSKADFSPEASVTPKKPKSLPSFNLDDFDLHFTFPLRTPLGFGLDEFDIEEDLYNGIEPLMKYSLIPMIKWTTKEVFEYINKISGCSEYAKLFKDEEIDGEALLLLKVEHMIHTMNLKLGPALKIASHLRLVKLQYGVETHSKYLSSPV